MAANKPRIGDLLIEQQLISQQQLQQAIEQQKNSGKKLGKVILDCGFVSEEQLLNLLSEQLALPFVDLKYYDFDSKIVKDLPETLARQYKAIILAKKDDGYLVGMTDPLDIYAYDEVSSSLKSTVHLALVREAELLRSIDLVYRRADEISGFAEALSDEMQGDDISSLLTATTGTEDAPVVRLLQSIFTDAVQVGASDIHIEPDEAQLRVRQRVDGILQEQIIKETGVINALTQRLKLMAGLNIAERRLPQDGRFSIKVKGRNIDVRLATIPVQHGEAVVMRVLDRSTVKLDLVSLGLKPELLDKFRKVLHKPHGIILVTGPTGSGKTTTLYAALNELNQPGKKIITVEDPVEYQLSRVNQVQVNPTIDLSFARVLRSVLRHDPDILLVGEIRDLETATIALRAAITGHLVLATLHTNDSATTALRLIDMGVPGYMVASGMQAVLSQRLVRRVCGACKVEYQPSPQELSWLVEQFDAQVAGQIYFHGKGCSQCNHTGYQGRVGVYEFLEFDEKMLNALRINDVLTFNNAVTDNPGHETLLVAALKLAQSGETTLTEVMRVVVE